MINDYNNNVKPNEISNPLVSQQPTKHNLQKNITEVQRELALLPSTVPAMMQLDKMQAIGLKLSAVMAGMLGILILPLTVPLSPIIGLIGGAIQAYTRNASVAPSIPYKPQVFKETFKEYLTYGAVGLLVGASLNLSDAKKIDNRLKEMKKAMNKGQQIETTTLFKQIFQRMNRSGVRDPEGNVWIGEYDKDNNLIAILNASFG